MMFTAMQAMLEYVSCLSDVYRFVYPVCVCVQAVPKPIAMEPCWGSRAGVLTVLLYLPRVPSGIPPPGQSGMIHTNTHEQTSKRHIECVYRERITACNCLIFASMPKNQTKSFPQTGNLPMTSIYWLCYCTFSFHQHSSEFISCHNFPKLLLQCCVCEEGLPSNLTLVSFFFIVQ